MRYAKYAASTQVSPEKSKAEIEELLRKYGADQFFSGWADGTGEDGGKAALGFRCQGRFVRFVLPLPSKGERRFHRHRGSSYLTVSDAAARERWEQEVRRRWRALALVIKAKLEAVSTGITSFESEFLAHIVMPDGRTVGEHVVPAIATAYETGKPMALLPEFCP
jgi:hypothetical protein